MSTGLMTRDEMLARLEAGEDAFDICIDKWKRIKDILDTGDKVSHDVIMGSTCALCEIHDGDCYGGDGGFLPCPLTLIDKTCTSKGNPWDIFYNTPTPKNAQAMIDAIKLARGD